MCLSRYLKSGSRVELVIATTAESLILRSAEIAKKPLFNRRIPSKQYLLETVSVRFSHVEWKKALFRRNQILRKDRNLRILH